MAQDVAHTPARALADLGLSDQARQDLEEFLAYAREFYLRCLANPFGHGSLELTRQDGEDLMWEQTVRSKQRRKHAKPSRPAAA